MLILLEIFCVGVLALLVSRLAPEPWRGRVLSVLKAWVTARAFWLLLSHPIALEGGGHVVAWKLIVKQLGEIDAATFWLFVLIATGVKAIGMLSSMYRWVLVLRGQGIELPFGHIFGSFLIGRAIGTFLPSTAGLDGYTLYDASRFSGRTVEVSAAKLLEKVCGFSGVFLTFLVALPFGISIFGENAGLFAGISIPIALGVIVALLLVLWHPGIVQWILEKFPIPGKDRLHGTVTRISNAAAAYRDKRGLVLMVLFASFLVHFTTAVMYYFTALAIGESGISFWQVTFGSAIQIFATVISPFTIAGEGIREAAQHILLGHLMKQPGSAILSAALGFWAAEAPTMLGFIFWWIRPKGYTPAFCRIDGVQVDWEQAAREALVLESDAEREQREARAALAPPLPLSERMLAGAGFGFGSGVLAGIVLGALETGVIAHGGFGAEAQVLWYGPLAYALFLGALGLAGGAALGVLPMDRREIQAWVPPMGLAATLLPLGLAVALFRIRRDVYLEQMPPWPVLLGVLGIAAVLALVILWPGRRFFRSRAGRIAKPLPALGLLAAVVAAGALGSVLSAGGAGTGGGGGIASGLRNSPNLILIMVDTLRADHLSCYGGSEPTPNLCRLARDGSRYQGFSQASWTKPSTATLLTSLLPSSHHAIAKPSKLSEDVTLVSEVMKERGYTTGGIVSNINLAASFGFDQGYDEYHFLGPRYLAGARESSSKLILYNIVRAVWFKIEPKIVKGIHYYDFYQDSAVVNEVAFDWLERHQKDRFFLFLHYMDVHDPYFAHPYDGHGIARVSNQHPDPAMGEEMHRLYRGEIAYLDQHIGKLLDELDRLGLYEGAGIALVADHGEEFFEHGGSWHGLTLYEEQIHVPLMIKWPADTAPPPKGATAGMARLLDVAPTLISLAGATPPASMQGTELQSAFATRAQKDRQVYSEEDHEGNVLWALRTETAKLIHANAGNPRGLPESALFAIDRDPHEQSPLPDGQHAALRTELEGYADLQRGMAEHGSVKGGGEADMSYQECEQLRMLGYVDDCSHLTK